MTQNHPIKAFVAEASGRDYIRIQHKNGNSSFNSSWSGMLQNLEPVETAKNIPLPIPKMLNSTAISIKLPSRPYLPPRDQWIYIQKHEVLYHRSGVDEPVKIIEINEPLPKTVVATGLNKYTDYVFYAHYYGKINGEDQNIITRYSAVMKTDEDVPSAPPTMFQIFKLNDTAVRLEWKLISAEQRNGIVKEYLVRYKETCITDQCPTWKFRRTNNLSVDIGLLKINAITEFQVSGVTSIGNGPWTRELPFNSFRQNFYTVQASDQFTTNIRFTDQSLVNHVYKTERVKTVEDCFRYCVKTVDAGNVARCHSLNIERMANGKTRICEINAGDHKIFPFDLIRRKGYQYHTVD